MKLAKDWEEIRRRVRWINTAFGLGRMVAEWEGYNGVRHKVTAITALELLSKVRTEIDSDEIEQQPQPATSYSPPKEEKPKPPQNPYRRKFG